MEEDVPTCNMRQRCHGMDVCGRLESTNCGRTASSKSGLEAGEVCGKLCFTLGNTPDRTREAAVFSQLPLNSG